MADPDWLGNAPESAFWGSDSNTVEYRRIFKLFEANLK